MKKNLKLKTMDNNLPPGVSNNTFGAPWNNIEREIKIEMSFSFNTTVSFEGPSTEDMIQDRIDSFVESAKKDISFRLVEAFPDYEVDELV